MCKKNDSHRIFEIWIMIWCYKKNRYLSMEATVKSKLQRKWFRKIKRLNKMQWKRDRNLVANEKFSSRRMDRSVHTCKTVGTSTMIIVYQIDACCTVLALTNTVINIFCACQTAPSFQTGTRKCARRIRTWFSINARSQCSRCIWFAFINIWFFL